jgi:hypothetical protein
MGEPYVGGLRHSVSQRPALCARPFASLCVDDVRPEAGAHRSIRIELRV